MLGHRHRLFGHSSVPPADTGQQAQLLGFSILRRAWSAAASRPRRQNADIITSDDDYHFSAHF